MKSIAFCGLAILALAAHAGPEDFVGTFKGDEKLTLTDCSNRLYNGTFSSTWQLTNQEVEGSSYKGIGHNSNGDFIVEAQIAGDQMSGIAKGTNKWGHAWSGEFSARLEQGRYVSVAIGSAPASGCRFTSEVEAIKISTAY